MHVLYFHQYFNTPQGASGVRSYEVARRLLARGHEVTMVCLRNDRIPLVLPGEATAPMRTGLVDGIKVIEFNLPYSNYMNLLTRSWIFFRFAIKGISLALRLDYDLIFATSTPLTAGIPGIFARLFRRKPFVFEVRDLWPELPKAMGVVKNPLVLAAMSFLEWASYRAARACVGLSPGIGEGIARRSRPGQPILVIPNACDLDLFQPGRREDLALPGIGPEDFVAVFCGAHGLANGLDAVLDTAIVLKKRGRSNIKLALIGDGKTKPALVERARRDGLDNCLFFPPMPKSQLTKVVGAADAGLMVLANVPAFYYGTSPNKFFDYISAGLPVINNYPGWLAELIQTHDCGEVVPPNNPEAFADALVRLADNPVRRRELGRHARQLAEKHFSRTRLANRLVDWLEAVYQRQAPAGLQAFQLEPQ